MKAKAVSLVLFHFHAGHHKEVNRWHDFDHRAELLGTISHIYHSQRWVAPADYVAARPPTDLPHRGGEYAVLYWSEGLPEQIQSDFDALGVRLTVQGRMQPMRYIEGAWRGRLRPLVAHSSPRVEPSAEAIPFAPNTGLVVSIVEVSDGNRHTYGRWLETVHTPEVLESGLFTGMFTLTPAVPRDQNVLVHFSYTDREDPIQAFAELLRMEEQSRPASGDLPDLNDLRRRIFTGVYRPIVPGQYDFYV